MTLKSRDVCRFASMVLALGGASSSAGAGPLLGTAQNFAVLGASTVTNTGATTIDGDIGVWPGTAITGLASVAITGTVHAGDATAMAAGGAAQTAFATLTAYSPTQDLSGEDLGGMTLAPGVYAFSTTAQLTGDLTLDFAADPRGSFVFQIGSTLTTAAVSAVSVIDGSATDAVYWEVGSSATLGSGTAFSGNILASQSITIGSGSTISGRALALAGAVTMDADTISDATVGGSVPEPSSWALMLIGAGWVGAMSRRGRGGLLRPRGLP